MVSSFGYLSITNPDYMVFTPNACLPFPAKNAAEPVAKNQLNGGDNEFNCQERIANREESEKQLESFLVRFMSTVYPSDSSDQ